VSDILEVKKIRWQRGCFVANEISHYNNELQTVGKWYDAQVKEIRHNKKAIGEMNGLRYTRKNKVLVWRQTYSRLSYHMLVHGNRIRTVINISTFALPDRQLFPFPALHFAKPLVL